MKKAKSFKEYNIININTPNKRAPKYIKQILTELMEEIDSFMIIVGGFNIPLSITTRTPGERFVREERTVTHYKPTGLTDICRTLSPQKQKYTFFPQVHMEHSPG